MKNISRYRIALVVVGLFFSVINNCLAQHVKTEYDHRVDFTRYKTYSWEGVKNQRSSATNQIKIAVDAALSSKGWTKLDSAGDISVAVIEINGPGDLATFYDDLGTTWGWRRVGTAGFRENAKAPKYRPDTLVVDLFDGKTRQLLWRSSANVALSSMWDDKSDMTIIEKIFKWFPPNPNPFDITGSHRGTYEHCL